MFDWIVGMVQGGGYGAVALLMFLENVFPPIPSELIMPLAGFVAAQGRLNLVLVLVAGSVGSLAGALFWYWIGLKVGSERLARFAQDHGRWLTLTPREVRAADKWFDRHGGKAVFLGRLIPGVRTLISVPAGVSGMRFGRFVLYSGLGTVLWTAPAHVRRLVAPRPVRTGGGLGEPRLRRRRRRPRPGLPLPRRHLPPPCAEARRPHLTFGR